MTDPASKTIPSEFRIDRQGMRGSAASARRRAPTAGAAALLLASVLAAAFLPSCQRKPKRTEKAYQGTAGISADMAGATEADLAFLKDEGKRQEEAESSLQRASIDLSATTIKYYGAQAVADGEAALPPEEGDLEIVDHGPEGELPVEMRKPTIYVMFNHPLVPLAKLGEPMTESPVLRIEPAVKGVYRWYGTRVLSFEPDEPLVSEPRYLVTVPGSAKSLGGKKLGKDFSFEIFTETLKAVNFYPGKGTDGDGSLEDVPTKMARYAIIEFNQEVDPDHLKRFIKATAGKKDQGFSLSRPEYPPELKSRTDRAVLLTLKTDPPENTEVEIVLLEGASPKKGYPAREGKQELSYRTVKPFKAIELTANSYDMPRSNKPSTVPVYAVFSHALDQGALKLSWTVTVNGAAIQPKAVELFGSNVRIGLEAAKPGDAVSVTPPMNLKDVYGRPLRNPGASLSCEIPDPFPFARFPYNDRYHLEAAYPPKLIWEARNVDSLHLGKASGDYFTNNLSYPLAKQVEMSAWPRNKVHYEVEDLKPYLSKKGYGTVLFNWKGKWKSTWGDYDRDGKFAVQVTDLGITARVAYNRVLVWVNSLSTGKPVAGATVALGRPGGRDLEKGKTDESGLAAIELGEGAFSRNFKVNDWGYDLAISASKGEDLAQLEFSDTHDSWTSTSYGHSSPVAVTAPVDRVMMFTDRGLYKGGEELALRGIHWVQGPEGFRPYEGNYELKLRDPRNDELLWSAKGTTSASGGYSQRFVLPAGLEPGEYRIDYAPAERMPRSDDAYAPFTVAAFRRLSFQVRSEVPPREFFAGDEVSVGVSASYLAGGAMGGAGYEYYWTARPVHFAPAGAAWKAYAFGPGSWEGERSLDSGSGKLSPSGTATIKTMTDGQNAGGSAYSYTAETTVQDLDRQAIASAASAVVHPAAFYIGARFASGSKDGWWSRFVATGKEVKLEAALASPSGEAWTKPAQLEARIVYGRWKSIQQQGVYGRLNTRWEYVEEEIEKAPLSAKDGKASWGFRVKESGDYVLTLSGKDPKGRLASTSIRFYASGSSWARQATETPETIELMAEKETYLPGETARIMVRSPLPSGKYLLTVEREGIMDERIVEVTDGKNMVEVPITGAHIPVVYVALSSFTKREAPPADHFEPDLGKPRGLFGIVGLRVSTRPIELDVEVKAAEGAYRPGTEAEVVVKVTRAGKPVPNGEVTVMAVDRGVLDLIGYHVPDPIDYFYDPGHFPLGVHGDDSRRLLLKPVAYDTSVLTGGDGEKPNERKDFRPLALFEPFVRTDDQGEARIKFKLPDTLTTYRLTALALDGIRLGLEEGEMMVQNPLNVRTAMPRRFRNRDTAAAGVVLQNLTAKAVKAEVTAESDILVVSGEKKRTVEVAPMGALELPFLFSGARPGEGTVTFTIRSDALSEKLTEKVIVERPLVKEAFATVGVIPKDASAAREGLVLPSAVAPGYGSLTVKASSRLRPYIEGSLDVLLDPPEPWASYYERLTHAFAAVYEKKSNAETAALLADMALRQQPGGGIYTGSYFHSPYLPDPYISVLCAWLMDFAESRGYKAPKAPDKGKLLSYVETLKADKRAGLDDPCSRAWIAMVLAVSGRPDPAFMKEVEKSEDALGLGGYGYLAQAYLASGDKASAERVYKRSKNFILMGTQKIDVKETYEATTYWSSELAEMALMLENATELGEPADFLMRLAGSMNKSERYWKTRNDDLHVLLGFIPLLDAEGAPTGASGLSVSAGGSALANLRMDAKKPQAEKSLEFDAQPLSSLPRDKALELELAKEGAQPVYYTSILRYALPVETARSRDEGIEVNIRYEDLQGEAVGEKELRLGDTYRVRVNVSSSKRRERLNLTVPVPNGVEIVDPAFATTGRFAASGGTGGQTIERETAYGDEIEVSAEGYGEYGEGFWSWYWYYPDSFPLDNMMVYRWTDFYAGSRELTFLVRVTTPGIYPTPPAQASLEFEPEVFGRTDGKLFIIKP